MALKALVCKTPTDLLPCPRPKQVVTVKFLEPSVVPRLTLCIEWENRVVDAGFPRKLDKKL